MVGRRRAGNTRLGWLGRKAAQMGGGRRSVDSRVSAEIEEEEEREKKKKSVRKKKLGRRRRGEREDQRKQKKISEVSEEEKDQGGRQREKIIRKIPMGYFHSIVCLLGLWGFR